MESYKQNAERTSKVNEVDIQMKRLGDISRITMGQSPDSKSYNDEGRGLPFYQGKTDFGDKYPKVRMYCDEPKRVAEKDDILMSVRAPIGDVNIATELCCIGRGLAAITAKDGIDSVYLFHVLRSLKNKLEIQGTGTTFKAIGKEILHNFQVPIYELTKQKQIGTIFECIDQIAGRYKAELTKLDTLVKAEFIELFGDPVTNPKGWKKAPLSLFGEFKNGMNFHKNDSGISIRCLGVSDFKNRAIIPDVSVLPMIALNEQPSEEYLLQDDDIVFVRSNGNKRLVGRCVAVYPGGILTIFSGFCIRFRRSASSNLHTGYLLCVLKDEGIREKLMGRGANIQNLNQEILKKIRIPVPPLVLQNQFADFVAQVEKAKSSVHRAISTLETLRASLMQTYFQPSDTFYSEANTRHIRAAAQRMDAGMGKEHPLLENDKRLS